MYFVVLPRALDFLTSYDDRTLRHPDPRELLLLVRHADAARGRARVPDADLHPRARPPARPDRRPAAPEPAHRVRRAARVRDPPADRRPGLARVRDDPAAHPLRDLDLALASSWRGAGTASWDETSPKPDSREGPLRRLGAPGRGAADSRRRRRDRGRADRRGRDRARSSASGEHFDEAVIVPGFVNAHTHLEYAVYAGFGDGLGFADWIGLHVERKARIDLGGHGGDRAARRARAACARGSRPSATASFSGAAARACAELGLRAIVYLEVFGATRRADRERFEPKRERIAARSRTTCGSASRRTRRTRARIELYAPLREARPAGRDAPRGERRRARWLRDGQRRLASLRGDARRRRPARPGSARSPRPACSTRTSSRRTASRPTPRRSSSSPSTTSPSPTARARTAARLRRRAARRRCAPPGSASASAPTAPPRRRRSTCSRSCARRSSGARARERRPDALTAADALELATLGGARALGLDATTRLARARQAGRSHRPLARGHAVRTMGGSCYGSGARRIPSGRRRYSRVRQTAVRERREDMARADRRRAQRAKPAAAARRSEVVIEDTMFFPRLRRHAKWMFLFLALVFALGFVGFGVGAGGHRLRRRHPRRSGRRRASRPSRTPSSASTTTRRTRRRSGTSRPRSRPQGTPTRRSRRSRATSRCGRRTPTRSASSPRLYLQKASAAQQRAQIFQARSDFLAPGGIRDTIFQIGGAPLAPDPITNAVSTSYDREISAAVSEAPVRVGAGGRAVPQDRADPAEGPERPARARPGRAVGERRRDDDRRVQGVPQARAGRPDRARGPPAPQAAADGTGSDQPARARHLRRRLLDSAA